MSINLKSHLSILDHAKLADLLGDAEIIELIDELSRSRNIKIDRGEIIVDTLGGPGQVFENKKIVSELMLSFSSEQRESIKKYLGVLDIDNFTLSNKTKKKLYEYFELEVPEYKSKPKDGILQGASVEYGLFYHQHKAMLKAIAFLTSEKPAVMLHMPTGSGKTRTAMHLICHLLNKKTDTVIVWLVAGIELCEQAAAEFQKAWSHLGIRPIPLLSIWGGRKGVDKESVTDISQYQDVIEQVKIDSWPINLNDGMIIASLDSLTEIIHKWQPGEKISRTNKISLIIFDEAHRSVAKTYKNTLQMIQGSQAPLLGLSATPGRRLHGDSESPELGELYYNQKVVLEIEGYPSPVEGLVAQGYLSELEKESLEIINKKEDTLRIQKIRNELANNMDISEDTLKYFGLNATRNLQIINRIEWLIKDEDHTRIIVFAPSVASSNLLANLLKIRFENILSKSVTSETRADVREEILNAYKSNTTEVAVLFNYGVLTTGFDAPQTSAVVVARPTKSIVLLSQMAGRALRGPKVGGSKHAKLITVVDTSIPELVDVVAQFHAFDNAWHEGETK